jgi:hypothetical protein
MDAKLTTTCLRVRARHAAQSMFRIDEIARAMRSHRANRNSIRCVFHEAIPGTIQARRMDAQTLHGMTRESTCQATTATEWANRSTAWEDIDLRGPAALRHRPALSPAFARRAGRHAPHATCPIAFRLGMNAH